MLPNPNPLARIFNTFLLYALKDGARAIRFQPGQSAKNVKIRLDEARSIDLGPGQKEVKVEFLIADSWRKQLQIPGYVLAPLIDYIESLQNGLDTIEIRMTDAKFGLGLSLSLSTKKIAQQHGDDFTINIERLYFEGELESKFG